TQFAAQNQHVATLLRARPLFGLLPNSTPRSPWTDETPPHFSRQAAVGCDAISIPQAAPKSPVAGLGPQCLGLPIVRSPLAARGAPAVGNCPAVECATPLSAACNFARRGPSVPAPGAFSGWATFLAAVT